MPVISAARMELLGFSKVEVGRIAGADLGGLAFGALLAALFLDRANRRILVMLGATLVVVANALCMIYPQYEPTLWLRGVAGIGGGRRQSGGQLQAGARLQHHAFRFRVFSGIGNAGAAHLIHERHLLAVHLGVCGWGTGNPLAARPRS